MKLQLKENPTEWVKFVLSVAAAATVVGLLLWWRQVLPGRWLGGWVGLWALTALLCLLQPRWFRGFYRAGMRLSFRLGQFMGWWLLTLFFLLALTPMGWLLRFLGKDLLGLKRPPSHSTQWRPARPSTQLERMF